MDFLIALAYVAGYFIIGIFFGAMAWAITGDEDESGAVPLLIFGWPIAIPFFLAIGAGIWIGSKIK